MSSLAKIGNSQITEIAAVEAQWSIARMFPRDTVAATQEIMDSARRAKFAERSHYLYKRGDHEIKGPTIRAAEEMARSWGNLDFGYRIIQEDDHVTIGEAFCIDMQRNTKQTRRFVVPHKRHTKRGAYDVTDPRDVYEMVASRGMRIVRSCILSMIPEDVVDQFNEICEQTIVATIGHLQDATNKMLKAFADIGVDKQSILSFLGKSPTDVNQYDILRLRRIYVSIKEGATMVSEWFPVHAEAVQSNAQKVHEMAARASKAAQERRKEEPDALGAEPKKAAQDRSESVQRTPSVEKKGDNKEKKPITKTTIGRIIGAFGRLDISKANIESVINKPIDSVNHDDVDRLRQHQREIVKDKDAAYHYGYLQREQPQEDAAETSSDFADTNAQEDRSSQDETAQADDVNPSKLKSKVLIDIESKISSANDISTLNELEETIQDLDEGEFGDYTDSLFDRVLERYRDITQETTQESIPA